MIELTKMQQQAVEAKGERILVSAGAGSGKTRVLVERFAHLVEQHGCPPEKIAALTFTDQAAAEMKERILARIRTGQADLHVLTFHRFCGQILRENPLLADVDPAFSILPDSRAKHLLRRLVMQQLRESEDPQIGLLLQQVQSVDLADILLALMQKGRERPLTWDEWRVQTEQTAMDLRKRAWSSLQESLRALQEFEQSRVVTAPGTVLRMEKIGKLWNGLSPQLRASGPERWDADAVSEMYPVLEAIMSEVTLTVAQAAKPLFARLSKLKKEKLWEDLLTDQTASLRHSLFDLMSRTHREYEASKQTAGWCDFSDLQDRVYHLLSRHQGVRERYGSLYSHVLVDEYQDTNPLQQAILELLEQGRRETNTAGSLFMVGDRRQSIYRFRGAEVKGFDAVQAALGERDCYLELRDNFRSTASLHALVSDLSATLFAEPVPETKEAVRADFPDLEILVPAFEERRSMTESEAHLLARRLRQLGPGVWGDTAILLQTRTHLAVFAKALHSSGIPYVMHEDSRFWSSQEVQDLLHVLRVLADPEDAVALLGFLRGPLIRMPDVELWKLAGASGLVQGFWMVQSAARAELERWRVELSTQPLTDWLHHLLYGERLEAKIGGRSLGILVQLAEEGEEHGIVTLDALLAWWRDLEAAGEKVSGRSRTQEQNAVKIMTIHAAKGLEFPIVCLPDLTHRQSAMMKRFHLCEQQGLAIRSVAKQGGQTLAYAAAAQRETAALAEEKKRLFYVGVTRAKEKVILSGAASACTEKRALEECSNWWDWLPFLFPDLQEKGLCDREILGRGWKAQVLNDASIPVFAKVRVQEAVELLTESDQAERQEVPRLLFRPSQKIWRVTELTARLTGQEENEAPPWMYQPRSQREQGLRPQEWGQIVHAVFEHLTPHDDEQAIRAQRIPAALARAGYADAALTAEVWERMREELAMYRRSALFQEMSRAVHREHEVPFSMELAPGLQVNGVIDALWLRDDGKATIVDYKTRRCETEREVEQLMAQYGTQVQLYALAVERLLGWEVDRVGVYMTAMGRFVEVGYGKEVREELLKGASLVAEREQEVWDLSS
ncbi:UvrD-helicase domain-containing protein [Tumebacillus avium]|uniref:UvrD-helicase domain-containing protein n=1 Tax=Tumebacillus avium TaxID=1903704 RepID=UPI0018E0216A|nr:UvrD-helicase domain-containing protein [Tumebacillus avium]